MKFTSRLAVKNRFVSSFFGIMLVAICVYTVMLLDYFETGLEASEELRLMLESNAFAEAYKENPQLEVPKSLVVNHYYDELPVVEFNGVNLLENIEFKEGRSSFVFSDDIVEDIDGLEAMVNVYRQNLADGRVLYTVAKYEYNFENSENFYWINHRFKLLFYMAFSFLGILVILLWMYNRKVAKQTSQLVSWAETITTQPGSQTKPDFRFDEYNRIAASLEVILSKNAQLIAREKKFLAHASHELRTPIAIIRANMEILERMQFSETAKDSINRIDRASNNMQLLTETLLWLERKSEQPPEIVELDIAQLIQRLTEEQNYLISVEEVELRLSLEKPSIQNLPVVPLQIVLNNLIRNAFQYTHRGWIEISYQNNKVIIENSDKDLCKENKDVYFGFGLGLELTEKVCERLSFELDITYSQGGAKVVLTLP
ncbi:sensor histidine kinase [Vibrio sp. SCSIO 43137]|uniref:sensor histidine kinase n=1 Tax=Vibrio sp. SCSIO 43137 TaxID=3021011 RepID=UPI002307AE87|nr:HAMP domain-containing sensor histidine kinase [Vibrio sp. SCSIO 43137]WCE32496.1 HAMP domain-containing sensor histidine kinase [Vibrio sp. SCSIO 43137]